MIVKLEAFVPSSDTYNVGTADPISYPETTTSNYIAYWILWGKLRYTMCTSQLAVFAALRLSMGIRVTPNPFNHIHTCFQILISIKSKIFSSQSLSSCSHSPIENALAAHFGVSSVHYYCQIYTKLFSAQQNFHTHRIARGIYSSCLLSTMKVSLYASVKPWKETQGTWLEWFRFHLFMRHQMWNLEFLLTSWLKLLQPFWCCCLLEEDLKKCTWLCCKKWSTGLVKVLVKRLTQDSLPNIVSLFFVLNR